MAQVAIRELRECFDGLDVKGGGTIGLPQLRAALRETQLFSEASLVNALFSRMDTDHSGQVRSPEISTSLRPISPKHLPRPR